MSGERFVRRAVLGDESILREVRHQALSDEPNAFGSTYEREVAWTKSVWQRWIFGRDRHFFEIGARYCAALASR